jgi:hypothetical protein
MWDRTAVGSEGSAIVDTGAGWRRNKPSTPSAGIGFRLGVPTSTLIGRRILVSMDLRGDIGTGFGRYIEGANTSSILDISKPTINTATWSTFTYEATISGEGMYPQPLPNSGGNTFKVCALMSVTGWVELRKGGTTVRVVS